MKAALYIRVSTGMQNSDMQERELTVYSHRAGWEVVQVYQDSATAISDNRPGFKQLLRDARAGRFDVVAVWKLDRFGRSLRNCIANLDELERYHVRFVATTQGIDTDRNNPASRFMMQMLAAAAEFEHSLTRERAAAGLQRYRQDFDAGKIGKVRHSRSGRDLPLGRPRRVFDRDKVVSLRAEGMSLRQIAKQLGVGLGTVTRAIAEAARCVR